MTEGDYPIGTPGQPWGEEERELWRQAQRVRRSYDAEVVAKLHPLSSSFELQCYGELTYAEGRYPLYGLINKHWNPELPWVLVTGGVHGYETSGVQGAIRFLEQHASNFFDAFNVAVAPCISPWGYETINRWNPLAIDPNRSFVTDSPSDEARLVMAWVAQLPGEPLAHFDLHETTDTDNSEFRPALAARDGQTLDVWAIPDGFYLVGDSEAPEPDFQRAMIAAVEQVTHIAPSDAQGRIIGERIAQEGVINYDVNRLGLCAGMTAAPYRTTTEVYPDSPQVDDENCILAQVAAVCAGLEYLQGIN
ncbi:MAG: M14 family metallocarboxypeptidase [Halieaceae bacterium]|jgi:hypothetical protein|nr:M14 family metallocarboxypeptidase [Halieaceae bacterium]